MCGVIYSSVGRASHRSRVRIPLKPWFFQASSFQKLENLMRWSFFTFVVVVVVVCCRCCCIVSGCFIKNKWQALTLSVCLTAVVGPGARPKQRKPIEVSGKTQDRNSGNKRKSNRPCKYKRLYIFSIFNLHFLSWYYTWNAETLQGY